MNDYSKEHQAAFYFATLLELNKKFPHKNRSLYKANGYVDRKWVRHLFSFICSDHDGPNSKDLLWPCYAILACFTRTLRRLCVLDNIVSLVSEEEIFYRECAIYAEALEQIEEAQQKVVGLKQEAWDERQRTQLFEILDELDQRAAVARRHLALSNVALRELQVLKRQNLSHLVPDGEVTEAMLKEYSYASAIKDTKSDLGVALGLYNSIPYACHKRYSSDHEVIKQTGERLRCELLTSYGPDAFFDTIRECLKAETT